MVKLTDGEIEKIRNIRIHNILGVSDNGYRHSMCCPIHSDRTPSFVLYQDNSYHCYGCNANGKGAIDFCMALGYSFTESVEELKKYL